MIPNPTPLESVIGSRVACRHGQLTAIVGPNFSGRSKFISALAANLGRITSLNLPHQNRQTVVLRPEVHLSITGLMPSCLEEITYHLREAGDRETIFRLLNTAGLTEHLERNPTTLSGGEQAALVLICKSALRPSLLAADCALEQINPTLKDRLLIEMMHGEHLLTTALVLADNRLSESALPINTTVELPNGNFNVSEQTSTWPIATLDSSVSISLDVKPCELDLCDLVFAYNRQSSILNGLSARFSPGGIHVIRGRNGAGKSTLAKIMCGVVACPQGEIKCDGVLVSPYKHPGRLTAYHFQFPDSQFVARTVWDDVASGSRARGLTGSKLAARVESILRSFGLHALGNAEIYDLPYVLRKRVAIASTIATGAPWMIFDEPTLGQDDQTCRALARIFLQLSSLGIGVLVISHSLSFTSLLNAQTHLLEKGKLV